jgi:hypothetical protein
MQNNYIDSSPSNATNEPLKTEFNETFTLTTENLIINIKRVFLSKKTFEPFKLIPIQNDAYFDFGRKISNNPLILPKLYAALINLTGLSDDRYDDYKGSYSFTFELEVQKNSNISKYCYHIYHYRSYIEFAVYHIVPESDSRNPEHVAQPNDELFSDKDIRGFSNFLYYYALGCMEKSGYVPRTFVKFSDSNLLLFGYSQNEYFYKEYEDQESYLKAKNVGTSLANNL